MSDIYPVKPHVAARSHLSSRAEYERLYRLSLDNPEWFWGEQAKALSWFHPWQTVFDADYEEVDFAWFSAGRLNASFNCVDRHLETHGDRTAIIWAQDEPGAYRHISYRELKHNVCRDRQRAALARDQARRPRLHLHADDAGARLHHAGLRADRRRALGGVRGLQLRVAARPHRGRRAAGWWSPPTRACAAASASRSRRPWTARSRACRWSRPCSSRAAPTTRSR